MAKLSIVKELVEVCRLTPSPGENGQDFAKRLAVKVNGLDDDTWASLQEDTQLWVNDALKAVEKKKDIELPDGLRNMLLPEGTPGAEKSSKPKGAKKPAEVTSEEAYVGARRGPKGKFKSGDTIKVLADKNPFREGTKAAAKFGKLKSGMTLEDAVEAGAPRSHIRWAVSLGHLEIVPAK